MDHPVEGRPQGHGAGDGGFCVHRAARHRVPGRGRHAHHGARGAQPRCARVTPPLAVLSRATCWALHRTPELNASLQGEQITVCRRVHLGIATTTDRGLMVPVVPDTHALSVGELALRIRMGDSGP